MINKIIEINWILEYLEKRNLVNQYKKSKDYLLLWYTTKVLFKKRKPYTSKIYQFRINNKYRAFWYFDTKNNSIFRVIEISDHQD
jgi:plasmid maintenance system killer protein